jgi:hypothetical protein
LQLWCQFVANKCNNPKLLDGETWTTPSCDPELYENIILKSLKASAQDKDTQSYIRTRGAIGRYLLSISTGLKDDELLSKANEASKNYYSSADSKNLLIKSDFNKYRLRWCHPKVKVWVDTDKYSKVKEVLTSYKAQKSNKRNKHNSSK